MKALNINLTHKTYPIYIEKGLMNSIGEEIKKIYARKNIVIVSDKNVWRFYGDKLVENLNKSGFKVNKIVVEPGEKSKSFDVLLNIYNKLLDFGVTRGDLIIALGGGVIGDLTGFAAATFLRGIPFVQIPTSLLAQIDSSIGGKVAVDLNRGKNLVGNFYHPEAVFIDSDVLSTLDDRYLYDGMAEVIKYACIRDEKLFYRLLSYNSKEELIQNMDYIIETCCNVKKEIVERDEKDTGDRMILNFGHTIGHAIEKYFNFEKYTHGEAVALGMYSITKKSEELGLTEKGVSENIAKMLKKYNLQYEIDIENKDTILEAIGVDKKNSGKFINIIILKKIGEGFIHKIEREEINKFI
ncbi:3-dehydroquinate synthase [Clostridium brassicae]|uniref:3-dehydroquinate synthase n=1 Tax=Clostridium brassicae TaxID=2999072 RepID=A0ABT4DC45_9CLOT|nr:3-dehydroquinate synthase [Clostridium brassicae]MCY6959238.1 3-dehydroquinate synthase [Clostridium brassicae]